MRKDFLKLSGATTLGLAAALSLSLVGCGGVQAAKTAATTSAATTSAATTQTQQATLTTGALAATHETKFGGVYLDITIDDFNKLGFELGDSVNVEFSNGYKVSDIPYFDGYYTKTAEPLICAYPGYPHIDVCINNGDPMWEQAGLKEGDTGTVTLHERGKYATVQKALGATYTNNRDDYASDEIFANFREMKGGKIAAHRMYRSASPIDNQKNRAPYASALAQKAGVTYILDLADKNEEIEQYYQEADFDTSWHKGLYESGAVSALDLNANYRSDKYAQKLVAGLKDMIKHDGPYLTHCMEGKDRTGFTCALLEGLCGATYEEMRDDYMITYDNYYGINEKNDKARYDSIVEVKFNDIALCVGGQALNGSLDGLDYVAGARAYLTHAGMTDAEVDQLIAKLTQ